MHGLLVFDVIINCPAPPPQAVPALHAKAKDLQASPAPSILQRASLLGGSYP